MAPLKCLAQCEREATASFIAYLAELDARRLYLAAGFSSLFGFPVILPMLSEGSLSLATVRLLAGNLTAENQQELLAAAAGKSKRQVEEMLVRYFPRPEVSSSVRRLPATRMPAMPAEAPLPASSVNPHGLGGEATVGNIRLLCRAHNAYEGEFFYRQGRRPERRTLPGKSAPRPCSGVHPQG